MKSPKAEYDSEMAKESPEAKADELQVSPVMEDRNAQTGANCWMLFSRSELIDQFEYQGFTYSEAVAGANAVELWNPGLRQRHNK